VSIIKDWGKEIFERAGFYWREKRGVSVECKPIVVISSVEIERCPGTDTGYGPQSSRRMPHEVIELVEIGMPPMDAIKAATSVSAECMGIERRTGSIKPGLEADLVAVERDPLSDIKNLQDIILVVNNGKVVVNRLGW
jgi:imidazolonepropionase-like amidohydrolase